MKIELTAAETVNVIDKMLELLGPNGERWCQGNLAINFVSGRACYPLDENADAFCLLGAFDKSVNVRLEDDSDRDCILLTYFMEMLEDFDESAIPDWNDMGDRTFPAVRELLLTAREHFAAIVELESKSDMELLEMSEVDVDNGRLHDYEDVKAEFLVERM